MSSVTVWGARAGLEYMMKRFFWPGYSLLVRLVPDNEHVTETLQNSRRSELLMSPISVTEKAENHGGYRVCG
jgi:hypothetical protein